MIGGDISNGRRKQRAYYDPPSAGYRREESPGTLPWESGQEEKKIKINKKHDLDPEPPDKQCKQD